MAQKSPKLTRRVEVTDQKPIPVAPVTDTFIESMRGSLANQGMPPRLKRDPDREFR